MRPPRFRHRDCLHHGFTLLELMVTIVIAGLLLTVSIWSMQHFLVGYRVGAAARELVIRTRNAAAIAARTNVPVELRFIHDAGSRCVYRYEIQPIGRAIYETVCLASEYPGVTLPSDGIGRPLRCEDEDTDLGECTLCTGTRTLTFYPSGEVATSVPNSSGDSVVFSVDGDTSTARTLAVGIRNVSGRTRIYRPGPSTSGWECP